MLRLTGEYRPRAYVLCRQRGGLAGLFARSKVLRVPCANTEHSLREVTVHVKVEVKGRFPWSKFDFSGIGVDWQQPGSVKWPGGGVRVSTFRPFNFKGLASLNLDYSVRISAWSDVPEVSYSCE